jgi:hypothetical protein
VVQRPRARAETLASMLFLAALYPGLAAPPALLKAQSCAPPVEVPGEEILQAMSAHGDYNLTATTNAARFGAEVLLAIVRRRKQESPASSRLLIRQPEWFTAHRQTAGVTYHDMSIAAREGLEHNQDVLIDFGAGVVKRVEVGPVPLQSLDVKIFWPRSKKSPSKFSYKDTLSVPRLNVYNNRVIRFKLLEYKDMVVFDEIQGISVRPMGFFSALFAIIGNPDLKQNRIATSRDQWQVMRGKVKAFLGISDTHTATIEPNGEAHEGVPHDRPDLKAVETRLKRTLKLQYGKSRC